MVNKMEKKYSKLLSNTFLFGIGSFASSLLSMLLTPLYTSILSTDEYGISNLITTTATLIFPFASLAMSEAILRFSLDKNSNKKTIFSFGFFLICFSSFLLLGAIPIIKQTDLGPFIIYFYLYFIFFAIHTISSYFTKGIEKIKIYAVSGIINSIIVIGCNLLFLLVFKLGIYGYLLSSIIGHIASLLFVFFSGKLYQYLISPFKFDYNLIKKMLIYSIPIVPNSISWWISNSSDLYVLNYFSTTSEVGIYSVSYKIPSIVMIVMGFFLSAWQLSSISCVKDEEGLKMFNTVNNKCFKFSFLITLGLIITSKPLGYFLYAKDFFIAWKYVGVLAIANFFNINATFLGSVYTATKKTKMMFVTTFIGAISNIIMNFLFIPKYGALGAAIATAISYLLMWVVRMFSTHKLLSFDINIFRDVILVLILFCTAALVYCNLLFAWIFAVIIVIVSCIVYIKDIISIIDVVFKALFKKYKQA